jgi:predicted Rossmann-fold nucleotide-binding protein
VTVKENVLVNAFRNSLYSPAELLGEFDVQHDESFIRTLDFRVYREYVKNGRLERASYSDTIVQSLHDNSITFAMRDLLLNRRVSAIMGGHRTPRDSVAYKQVVRMARQLTRSGILMCSGGGPGAMEATHLGASLANSTDADMELIIATLAKVPELPPSVDLVAADGAINMRKLHDLHAWQAPAFQVAAQITNPGTSLAIPTWHYGHEPPSPFATHIAKYFQNSLREDGLLAIARQGVIYTEGRAGTLQEVFQDAAQNYYQSFDWFSPMVFFGVRHWTEEMPVVGLLQKLFKADYDTQVLLTDNPDEAVAFICSFVPPRS